MAKWTNLERAWSSWNIFQLKMLNFLTTFDKQFCGSTNPGDYYDKGLVKLIKRVKITHSFLQSVSNQFHVIILILPM